jgi:hypothetical protein
MQCEAQLELRATSAACGARELRRLQNLGGGVRSNKCNLPASDDASLYIWTIQLLIHLNPEQFRFRFQILGDFVAGNHYWLLTGTRIATGRKRTFTLQVCCVRTAEVIPMNMGA